MSTRTQPRVPEKRARIPYISAAKLELRADEQLPAGVCGRLTGIALVYGVVDTWGTRFAKGCLDRTRAEKLAAGKVKLFAAVDTGQHQYGTSAHVGTVRVMKDVGDSVVMEADLFGTPEGRALKEYVAAVLATGSETGLSVGVYHRDGVSERTDDGDYLYTFTEVELVEVTVTPMSSVPGTQVTAVRAEDHQTPRELQRVALDVLLRSLPTSDVRAALVARYGNATVPADSDAGGGAPPADSDAAPGDSQQSGSAEATRAAALATMDERTRAFRASFLP